MNKSNVLLILTDQMRFDAIRALGNNKIYTPNLDYLVNNGTTLVNAYSPSPVCVPARYCIRTGRSPLTTRYFQNEPPVVLESQETVTQKRCGKFLAQHMRDEGYRTFGIGKFHTIPVDEDIGYGVYQRCEEMDGYPDSYTQYINSQPAYRHLEQLQGERTNMYYQPQTSALPKELTSESWVADRVIEQINKIDDKPFFGVASFVGPHPPFAPPIPFNRMYNPDEMDNPVIGPNEIDFMDERVPWNNYFVFADDFSNSHFRTLKSRYYGEISYIDWCIGKIIKNLKEKNIFDDTMIIFTADHGEFLGDHQTVQKENFFEQSCHIPMIVSYPEKIPKGVKRENPATLLDIFGLVTSVTQNHDLRDGRDLFDELANEKYISKQNPIFGFSSEPGSVDFRMMALSHPWKYIFHANGGGELLFNLNTDPEEHENLISKEKKTAEELRNACIIHLNKNGELKALDNGGLKQFPRTVLKLERCYQMNSFRGVEDFPFLPENIVYCPATDEQINIQFESKSE
jgi:arylsulfatase